MRVIDHIRKHLESRIRPDSVPRPPLSELRATEWSDRFERYQRNRLIVGAIRYQTFKEKSAGHSFDLLSSVRDRLTAYERDGNLEHLVDSANLLMIEFESPKVDGAHFTPIDDGVHVEVKQ